MRRKEVAALTLLLAFALCGVTTIPALAAASGELDPTFGVGGKVTTDFDGRIALGSGVVVQPDGKVLAAGAVLNNFNELGARS